VADEDDDEDDDDWTEIREVTYSSGESDEDTAMKYASMSKSEKV
jgi:Ion transport protein